MGVFILEMKWQREQNSPKAIVTTFKPITAAIARSKYFDVTTLCTNKRNGE